MPLEADIVDRVRVEFRAEEAPTALDELAASGATGRIARCIVLAAGGSLERLRELIRLANCDYRDVIVAGEYEGNMRQVRDLRVSFLIALPDDFWVGETAVVAHKRAFRLTSLESRPAIVGPFEFTGDRNEGLATFTNGANTLSVQKHNRQWSISAPGRDLRPHGLDEAFDDEERFRVQLDVFLSGK